MIVLLITLGLIFLVGILGSIVKIISIEQTKFIVTSSILYIVIFGFVLSLLTKKQSMMEVLNNHSLYIPVIFYVFWFMISAILSNSLTSGDSLTGYFSKDNKYMSKRNVMPR
jgi:hypothetical protein